MQILRRAVLAGFFMIAAVAQASRAQGLACAQDCSDGTCAQADCAPAAGNGFCECGGGAQPWGEDAYLAYCRAWGRPQVGCGRATPVPDPSAISATPTPVPVQLPNAAAMEMALAGQNPYVATLLKALQDGGGWVDGLVHGLLHGVHYDSATGLAHGEAIAFAGQVTPTAPDTVQIDVTLTGDTAQLTWVQQYLAAAAPAAILPQSIHGTVSGGAQHGSLAVTAMGGRSQTIQW